MSHTFYFRPLQDIYNIYFWYRLVISLWISTYLNTVCVYNSLQCNYFLGLTNFQVANWQESSSWQVKVLWIDHLSLAIILLISGDTLILNYILCNNISSNVMCSLKWIPQILCNIYYFIFDKPAQFNDKMISHFLWPIQAIQTYTLSFYGKNSYDWEVFTLVGLGWAGVSGDGMWQCNRPSWVLP